MKTVIICIVVFMFLFYPFIYSLMVIAKRSDEMHDIAFRNYLRKKMDEERGEINNDEGRRNQKE